VNISATAASEISAENMHDIMKHTAAAIKRIHGAASYTEAAAGVFTHATASFSGQLDVAGTLDAGSLKGADLSQYGVVVVGADGQLTTTASLVYSDNRLVVSSSIRVSGDLAVNGEGGVADITSTAPTAAIFDAGVNTIYMGADAELIQIGEMGGLVDFAGDVRLTGSVEIAGTAATETIKRTESGALSIMAGDLDGANNKVKITLSGSELRFDDGYRAGWNNDIKLAGSQNDWDRFKNIFGEASILQAISNAAALPTDAKFMYKVASEINSPAVVGGDALRQVNGTHFSGSFAAVPSGSRNENVDVFLNGQLLVSKSYDAVNYDYDIAANGSSITFNFDLQPDDFISVLVPVTVASVADYVAASGAGTGNGGGGGGGGGSETFSGTYTSTYTLRATSTDGNATELTTDGASPTASNVIVLANNSTSVFDITVVGRRIDADGEGASYEVKVTLDRNANAASTALVGSGYKLIIAEDSTGWDVGIAANTTDGALRVTVTGQAGKTIKWTAFVREVKSVE
jgi:hypothetical protein